MAFLQQERGRNCDLHGHGINNVSPGAGATAEESSVSIVINQWGGSKLQDFPSPGSLQTHTRRQGAWSPGPGEQEEDTTWGCHAKVQPGPNMVVPIIAAFMRQRLEGYPDFEVVRAT